jgi:DnaJ-class molecular chaperone
MANFARYFRRLMKHITEYKKLFNVEGPIQLAELKTNYRNLVKEWHPDKFLSGDDKAKEAEEKSRQITQAYEFLKSIAPETIAKDLDEYNAMLASSAMADFQHKKQILEVTFNNGMTYEYFGVPEKMYSKLCSSPTPFRFAKRNIFNAFPYRRAKREKEMA